jgi:hypothetical protein
MAEINITKQHITIGDLSKPPADIPTGVWHLRAISLKTSTREVNFKDGPKDATVYTLALEPLSPTESVDPDALADLDPMTGRPTYDGKRLFIRFTSVFANEMRQLGSALQALGFTDEDDFGDVVENNRVKGRTAYGEIFTRSYPKNDGTTGTEQKVKGWASSATAGAVEL